MAQENQSPKLFENLLFPTVFRSFRMAIQPGKLLLGLAAIAVVSLTGWLMDLNPTVIVAGGSRASVTELDIYIATPERIDTHIQLYGEAGDRAGVFETLYAVGASRFGGALNCLFSFNLPGMAVNIADCFKALWWAVRYHFLYSLILLGVTLAALSVAGGAICRLTAVQLARDEKPGTVEAARFAARKFVSFFAAPVAPLGIVIFIGLFVFVLGLVGNIPRAGELIMGIFMGPALIAGALMAIVLIGTVAGFNLMFPAVAYDGSDCFDAISRSFSYIFSRPWRMTFYTLLTAAYGAVCYTFVRFLAFLTLWSTRWAAELGVFVGGAKTDDKLAAFWPQPTFTDFTGQETMAGVWSESAAAFLVYIFTLAMLGLVVSFLLSFYFSANTVIYALMRKAVDNTAIDDIHMEPIAEERPQAPETPTKDSESGQDEPTDA